MRCDWQGGVWLNESPLQFPLASLRLDRLLTKTGKVDLVGKTFTAGCRGEVRRWWYILEIVSSLNGLGCGGEIEEVNSASPDDRPVLNSTVPFCVGSVQPQETHSLQVSAKTNATPSTSHSRLVPFLLFPPTSPRNLPGAMRQS